MKKVKEFMDIYSQEIIRELGKKEFNTADVVSTINQRKEWQKEYIKLSEQYGSYNKLNAQIGRYLLNNQNKLEISKNGDKEKATAITGRQSSNQKWIKIIKKQERMNKLKTMALIASLIALYIGANAQTLTPQQRPYGSSWGYVNENGKVVIEYKYYKARAFSEELAAVMKDNKWGFVDKTGKNVIKCKYSDVSNFSEELAAVRTKGKWGFVNKKGKVVIKCLYDAVGDFSEELAAVSVNDKWGFIDKTGKEIIPLQYSSAMTFSKGFAKVKKGDYWGLIDKSEAEIIPFKYQLIRDFSEGLAAVKRDNKWGFVDTAGKEHIECKYDNVGEFSEGFAIVSNYRYGSEMCGVIDKTGKQVLPFGYSKTEINSMPLSAFVEKEVQRIQEEERQRKLEEEIKAQKKAEILAFFEEVEPVLDNDYYSADSHSSEVLKELMDQLKTIKDEISFVYKYNYDSDEYKEIRSRSSDLDDGLRKAYNIRVLTENYGVATAKKIMAGRFEIGMSKIVCKEVATVTGKLIKTMNQTTNTELWKAYGFFGGTTVYLHFTGDKLVSISY